ncbi:LLM class flavin-dependent oxidoreductase [Streptomyces sp. 049-1]|uniref:LLM class flavin-dependent oxidoreductase n=1 Tax=Streptomyces sp. 049-1 TaxID=2789264 RepID=UPI0039807D3A
MSSAANERTAATLGSNGDGPVRLSILDLVPVGDDAGPQSALRWTTELAKSAERWGYHRFWVPEHHSFPASASPAPAVLLAHLAAVTQHIRLGSGGVMLTNHAPLLVAEQFGLLDLLYPGRVDLGVGRASGGHPVINRALRRDVRDDGPETYPEQVAELLGFMGRGFPDDHPYTRDDVHVVPASRGLPVWMLGSGMSGAEVAARFGLPFAGAYHINPEQSLVAIDTYRDMFQPSATLQKPYAMVSVNVVCAETDTAALRLARSGALAMAWARSGLSVSVPTPETAEGHTYTAAEQEFTLQWLSHSVHGSPETVRHGLEQLRKRTRADELMLTTLLPSSDARHRSYELVAREFGLHDGTSSR